MKTFDAAVVGLGTMGIFVCREFARRRLRVIGFDQFDPPPQPRQSHGRHAGVPDCLRRTSGLRAPRPSRWRPLGPARR